MGDIIRVRVASLKPPYVFGKQLILWCLKLVKTVPKYELSKFLTLMKATSYTKCRMQVLVQQDSIYYVIDPWCQVISGRTRLYHFCNVLEDNLIK